MKPFESGAVLPRLLLGLGFIHHASQCFLRLLSFVPSVLVAQKANGLLTWRPWLNPGAHAVGRH